MGDTSARKAITMELFAATGESIPENDPIVTGAILFTHKLNEVARLSAEEMRKAGDMAAETVREAAFQASGVLRAAGEQCAADSVALAAKARDAGLAASADVQRLAADRAHFLKIVEAHVVKCVKVASRRPVGSGEIRYIPLSTAAIGAVVGAIVLAATWHFGFAQGAAHAQEAAVGRTFTRAVSTMDPKLRDQVIEHIRKNSG